MTALIHQLKLIVDKYPQKHSTKLQLNPFLIRLETQSNLISDARFNFITILPLTLDRVEPFVK